MFTAEYKVGENSYIESLQSKAKKFKRSPSEILRTLNVMFKIIGSIVVAMAIAIFVVYLIKGGFSSFDNFKSSMKGISGSMLAMIPAGLYLLTSVALAVAVLKLSKRGARVQDFYSVEMLARINVLCAADGQVFDLEDWQVSEFCGRLSFVFDEAMPIETAWPFKWDRYLMNTSFGDWFHADAQMLGFTLDGDIERLKCAMKDLGDPHDDLQPLDADVVLMLKWYDCFKDWLQERYPFVFQKAEPGTESPTSPIEARQSIMLMLNDGRPQDNEAIEKSNMHDVLAALQHKIEEAKHIEEQMKKIS